MLDGVELSLERLHLGGGDLHRARRSAPVARHQRRAAAPPEGAHPQLDQLVVRHRPPRPGRLAQSLGIPLRRIARLHPPHPVAVEDDQRRRARGRDDQRVVERHDRDRGRAANRVQPAGEARVRRAVLQLGAPAARHASGDGQLRQPADERLGVVTQRERTDVALGLVRLVTRGLPEEARDQSERPEGHEEFRGQPVEGEGGAQRRGGHESVRDGRHDPAAPPIVVLEVRDFVREDGRLLARAEQLQRGIGEEHARHARGRKREGVDEASARHRHVEQSRARRPRAVDDRLPLRSPRPRAGPHEPDERLRVAPRPQAEQHRERAGDGPAPDARRLDHRRRDQQGEPEAEPREMEPEVPEHVGGGRPPLVEHHAARRIVADPVAQHEAEHGEPVVRPGREGEARRAEQRHALRVLGAREEALGKGGIVALADEAAPAPPGEHAGDEHERQERPQAGNGHQ